MLEEGGTIGVASGGVTVVVAKCPSLFPSLLSYTLAPTNPLPVSVGFPVLDMSHKWNYTLWPFVSGVSH